MFILIAIVNENWRFCFQEKNPWQEWSENIARKVSLQIAEKKQKPENSFKEIVILNEILDSNGLNFKLKSKNYSNSKSDDLKCDIKKIIEVLGKNCLVGIDFEGVEYMDSRGTEAINLLADKMESLDGVLVFSEMSPRLKRTNFGRFLSALRENFTFISICEENVIGEM